jgi:hypothetical protein
VIPNITRGDRMAGLLVYLVGPGRHNEHEEPHLVAGDSAVMAWHDDAELNRQAAVEIARTVDHPRRAFDVSVARGSVWHCSLSLHKDEGVLTDERWAQISEELVAEMGFAGPQVDAPCRWVAVRHGLSKAGNDHVHVVVSLVHEDGSKANVWNDRHRAQVIVGELERRHHLAVLESRQAGLGSRGFKPAEPALAHRRGQPEIARDALARTVRGCASAAQDEAEFVRRVRQAGVKIRPRFAAGRGDVVAGYSVALQPAKGDAPVWYGGGHLGRDLTLPRLREGWPDSPEHAAAAAAEWTAAKRNQRPVVAGLETQEIPAQVWDQCVLEVAQLREQLRLVDPTDRATWAHVAQETAGAFAAWSMQVEGATPGPLAETAHTLARSAQLRAHRVRPRPAGLPAAGGVARLFASVAAGGRGTVGEAVMLRQLANTIKALHDAHQAAGELRYARELRDVAMNQLVAVNERLPQPITSSLDPEALEAARLADAGRVAPRPPGSPVPGPLPDPDAERNAAADVARRGGADKNSIER